MNIETDFVDPSVRDLSRYKLIVAPVLYAISDGDIAALKNYVRGGGHLLLSFKSGFFDEKPEGSSDQLAGRIRRCCRCNV